MRTCAIVAIMLALALTLPGRAGACGVARVPGAGATLARDGVIDAGLLDAAVLAEVNAARCQSGIGPLVAAPGLLRVATVHSVWMARTRVFSHDGGPAGQSSLSGRLKRAGIAYSTGAENIATVHLYALDGVTVTTGSGACDYRGPGGRRIGAHSYASLAAQVVAQWMASPGHRANILNARLRQVGTGAGFAPGAAFCGLFYLTQDFAG